MTTGAISMFSLVAVIAWTTAAQGGTRAVDLGIVTVLLLTALLGSTGRVGRLGRSPTLLSVLVLEVWLIAAGTRGGTPVDLVSLRVPAVVLVVVLTVCIAARLDSRQRAVVIDCVVVVGVVQACTAIEQVVLESWSTGSLTPASRPVGLLGNANALGILLVATAALTLRASLRSPSRVTGAALAVQGGALLLTASRLALIAAALVLVSCLRIPRRRWVAAAAAVWLSAAAAIVGARFVVTGGDRIGLWIAAFRQIEIHPLVGRGVEPVVLDVPGSVVGPTTHAHNEAIQFVLEYGLIGLALTVLTVVLTLRSATMPGQRNGLLLAAGAALLAGGLTDVGLRVTAIAMMAALLLTIACTPPVDAHAERRRSDQPSAASIRDAPSSIGGLPHRSIAAPALAPPSPTSRRTAEIKE